MTEFEDMVVSDVTDKAELVIESPRVVFFER